MHPDSIRNLLRDVAAGSIQVDQAVDALRDLPFESLDFATVDHHRSLRCGFAEVVYGEGKTDDQIEQIFARLAANGNNVLATRVGPGAANRLRQRFRTVQYHEIPGIITLRQLPAVRRDTYVGIVAAGTSDLRVAEEARVTVEIMDERAEVLYDVGVAGLHRLLAQGDFLRKASVLVVVAGMEGALPSVVGGLVGVPVIAVPTSVGYGASFGGIAALLGMLNSCAPGVSVVNIDNGFGAGYQAAMICRLLQTHCVGDSQSSSAAGEPSHG